VAVALEEVVLADVDAAVQVAARRPALAGLALAAERDAHARVHPRRHVDLERALGLDAAAAVAGRAGGGDDLAAAAAAAAGLLHAHEAAEAGEHDAAAVAVAAPRRPAAAAGAAAGAVAAQLLARDGDGLAGAEGGLAQVQLDVQQQVAA